MSEQRYSENSESRRDIPSFIEPRPPLIQNPFMRPKPQKGTNLLELFEEDSEIEEPDLVQVYLRLKPCKIPNTLYEIRSDKCLVTSLDTATAGHGRRTQHNVSKMYTFSKIFGSECSQKDIFEQVVKDNLKKLPEGHNFTLLTYGASGSGKTYTLMGTVGSPGLVPRSLEYVFKLVEAAQSPVYKPAENGAEQLNYAEQDFELQWVKRLRHVSAPLRDKYRRMSVQLHSDLTVSSIDLSNRVRHYVWVSFVEIYNEAIYDLLAPPEKRSKLRIREDTSGNVYVKGATHAFVRSGEEAYDVMVAGKHNLVVAATGVHAHSSRSHCIFTITMLTETGEGGVRSACVRLCDLAGCERARATRNTGARMLESRAINSSLHVLERCLHMLRRKQRTRHDALVPYRESKLTRLLGTGLSGARGEAVSMVVTLNPSAEYAHETKHVLSLAAVAQDIQINNTMLATTTLESSTQDTTINCSSEVMKLRSDNERLHFELVQAQARHKELMASMEEKQQETANTMRELVEEAKDMTREYYVAQLEALRAEMDETVEEYEERLAKVSKEAQSRVDTLMTEIAILQEKLTAEQLARARTEKEVQHLRTCIEERDEKTFKDTTPAQELMDLSDSEHESDEDISDPLNESLEPIFRKEMNKSMVKQSDTVSVHTIDNIGEENEDIDEENEDIDNDVHENTKVNDTKDSTIVDENEITHNSKCEDLIEIDSANSTYESAKRYSLDKASGSLNDSHEDSMKAIHDKVNNLSVNDNIKIDSLKNSSTCRGTYFVRDTKDNSGVINTKDSEEKSISSCRSTYFVSSHATDTYQNTESNDKDVTFEHFIEPVIEKTTPKVTAQVSETLVSKIIHSLKNNHSNDSSLTQFEQLEMASKKFDEDAGNKSSDSTEINILKEKKTYFGHGPSESTVNTDEIPSVLTKEKRTFFDNIDVNMHASTKKIDLIKITDEERSPSIVKDNLISESFEPSKIKKLLGESFSKPEIITSVHKKRIAKKHESVDIFESPVVALTNEKSENNIEMVKQSIDRLVLSQQSSKKDAMCDIKLASPRKEERHISPVRFNKGRSPIRVDFIRSPVKHDITKSPAKIDTAKARLDIGRSPVKYNVTKSSVKSDTIKSPNRLNVDRTPNNNDIAKSPETDDTEKYHKKKDTVELPTEQEIANWHMKDVQKPIKISEYNKLKQNDFVRSLLNKDDASTQLLTRTETAMDPHFNIKQEKDLILTSLTLQNTIITNIKKEILDPVSSTDEANKVTDETNDTTQDNTAELFENIYKDITAPRATEFELLVSQSLDENNDKNEKLAAKYNLRKKFSKNDDTKSDKDKVESSDRILESGVKPSRSDENKTNKEKVTINDEILLESQDKCESKPRKRTLRLRRKKNQGDDESDDKLKDIVNLQTEFSDVTMGVPVAQKVVKDIPSPEKGTEENLPPILGIQSCPAKSITRSRRKLFTPRAEPLEESITQTGDSNERIYVPRPSYHRPRARRKL